MIELAIDATAAWIALLVTAPGHDRRRMAAFIVIFGTAWFLAIRPALLALVG